jgi:hypothetical protein
MARSHNGIKKVVVVIGILALLFLLAQLFRRPPQPARDFVFGDLGRPPSALTNRTESTFPPPLVPPAKITTTLPPTPAVPLTESNENIALTPTAQSTNEAMSNAVAAAMAAPPFVRAPEESSFPPTPPREIEPSNPAIAMASYTPPSIPEPDTKPSTAELLATTKGCAPSATVTRPKSTASLLGLETAGAGLSNSAPVVSATLSPGIDFPVMRSETNVSFVVDQSLSMMREDKTSRARSELLKSLESLGSEKTFYILFFHSGGYEGMPSLGPVLATPENIRAMTNWLFSIGHRFGSDPAKGVRRALGMVPAPDIV